VRGSQKDERARAWDKRMGKGSKRGKEKGLNEERRVKMRRRK
jgi:hypothetical protein